MMKARMPTPAADVGRRRTGLVYTVGAAPLPLRTIVGAGAGADRRLTGDAVCGLGGDRG